MIYYIYRLKVFRIILLYLYIVKGVKVLIDNEIDWVYSWLVFR